MKDPIIGIDLGTTNSCAAVCHDTGSVELIKYSGGELTLPSIVAVDEKGRELVGHEAKRQWQLNPRNTIFGSKRLLGTTIDSPIVAEVRKHVTYEISGGEGGEVVIPVGGRVMRLHEVAGRILSKVREVATSHLGVPVSRAVVTVPAYYSARQRQAVYRAGKDIGLEIVRIINEPTAAALAYGARQSLNQTIAVYDLGGGTFDLSVIEIRNRVFEVKATGGDIFLGGIDFDNVLIKYIVSDFQTKHGVDLSSDPVAMQRIRDMSERVKIDLSSRLEAVVRIPFITMTEDGKPLDVEITIRREELETLTADLVEKTFVTVAAVLGGAGKKPSDIDAVLLVGGQTRMPMIGERIGAFFGKPPSKGVHPDEAVAIGAALFAWSLDERSDLRVQLLDVLPMTIGIEAADGKLRHLFEHNSAVPNRKLFTFTTHADNQPDLAMRIYQGEKPAAKDNILLGEFTFAGIRPGPAGSVRVEVVFDVSSEGILTLEARDTDSKAVMKQSVRLGAA